MANREFSVPDQYAYNRRTPERWIVSHILRHKRFLAITLVGTLASNILFASVANRTGAAFTEALTAHPSVARLTFIALTILLTVFGVGLCDLAARLSSEVLANRFQRDARAELYINLLGKSQTFHNRQRVGDIMARASNDTGQLNSMVSPGMDIILDSSLALLVPIIFIAFLSPQLLLAPLLFTVAFIFAIRRYMRELSPVSATMRQSFGAMNAGLEETITGVEVVKATAQEEQERHKFERNARAYRDAFVRNGQIQARYLPPLLLALALVGAFAHGVFLVSHGQLSIGGLVAYMTLMGQLRFVTNISIFSFSLVQLGIAGARRILETLGEESDLDENAHGHAGLMRGELHFERVSFSYGGPDGEPLLRDISFTAQPGRTIAIVGQTGAGKTTLTKLINRIYDVTAGRVLIDDIDVRQWSLDALRSQISTIEQDVFLFSRTIAENIAFSQGEHIDMAAVEQAARAAQAHDFIMGFKDGYHTIVGERGVTLSGGQRQRLAIARALLTDPRILMLDDSTSAIDSATEDDIQHAIRRAQAGRTTILITHRLSQIRWADWILVLRKGELLDQGTHQELLTRCDLYRRIFARYDGLQARRAPHPTPQPETATHL